MLVPPARDVDAAGDPGAALLLHVVDEFPQRVDFGLLACPMRRGCSPTDIILGWVAPSSHSVSKPRLRLSRKSAGEPTLGGRLNFASL